MLMRTICVSLLLLSLAVGAGATGLKPSIFEEELMRTKFGLSGSTGLDEPLNAPVAEEDLPLAQLAQTKVAGVEYKSPSKAFLYSLAVPGLGQYYYGSRVKPVVFLATEVTSWIFALKYHSQGEDATAAYQAFNREHWIHDRYDEYLFRNYGSTKPDTLKDSVFKELTEVLPGSETQQYFEMTGKYDEFAWGWDDAVNSDGNTWDSVDVADNGQWFPARIINAESVPSSVNRNTYEGMRDDANSEYNRSMRFVFVLMGNHLISAFEAYFATKRNNNRLRYEEEFARFDVDATVRSYSHWKDTPYVSFSYKF